MEPKIRFKGFEGEWEKVKLGNVCSVNRGTRITKKELNTNHSYPVYQNTNYPLGYYKNYNVEANNPYVIIGGSAGLIGFSNVPFWAADDCAYFGDNDSLDKAFLYSTLLSHIAEIKKNVRGSSVPRLDRSTLIDLEINLPSFSEQQFIATYFRTLDNKIQSTSKKLASLKKLKSASLVAMFPQNGESTPKVRFKGFEGEWKKVKFLEIFEFLKNNSLSRAELSSKGDFINIHYGDILIKYGDLVNIQNEELTYIRDCRIGQTLYKMCSLQNGDIIIADAAEDYSVGKCSEIVNIGNNKVVSGLHTIPCRPLITFAQGYLGHYINSNSYHNQLLPLIQGSKISSISKKTLSQTSVFVPSYEEQQAIATFFRSLDRKIALETARLEKLKQIKLACLDKMFV